MSANPIRRSVRSTTATVRRLRERDAPFVAVALSVVFGSLLGIVTVQTLIIQNRVELDDVTQQLEIAREENRRLRLEVLELEAPDRVLSVAIDRLGMVRPDERRYLPGIDPAAVPVRQPETANPFAAAPLPPELGPEAVAPVEEESG